MAVSLAPNGEATALLVNELHEANILRGIEAQTMPFDPNVTHGLMPIGDFPILEVVVRQLVRDGFEHISMAVNHL